VALWDPATVWDIQFYGNIEGGTIGAGLSS
jgi:hypothetical protein